MLLFAALRPPVGGIPLAETEDEECGYLCYSPVLQIMI